MKIGIDVSPIFRQRGGVGTYTLHLTEQLLRFKTDHAFFLFSTEPPNDSIHFLKKPDVHVIHGSKPYLRYRIWKEKIDIVHGPNFRLPGKGTRGNVITIHDLALVKYPEFGKKRFGSGLAFWRTRKRALSADRIVADSQNTLEDIVRFTGSPREKIKVIHLGVDPFYRPEHHQEAFFKIRQKFKFEKEKYVLFAGTIEPRKNVKTLVQAFAKKENIRKTHCLVLAGGAGWKYDELKELILKEKLGKEICVTGYISNDELRILYSHASCFVFPSIYEGFGMPPLEAMACGTPVICSNVSSLPEVVGEAAITLDPFDVDGFSDSIEKIINNKNLRKEMIEKGYQRVKQFSWEETARKTLRVYEDLFLNG
ncbi:MAG: glycosyltransferase family 4 protein [Nitrospirae bacterium]|nr:glycosyltransferase family 4 protein [Nitrospirota bacterium]